MIRYFNDNQVCMGLFWIHFGHEYDRNTTNGLPLVNINGLSTNRLFTPILTLYYATNSMR